MAELSGKVSNLEYGGGHVADVDNWDFSIDTNMLDVTSFTTGDVQWREMIDGLSGANGTVNFNYNADSTGLDDMITNTITPTTSSIKFELDKVGGGHFTASSYISGMSMTAPIDGKVTGSFNVQITGAVTYAQTT